MSSSIENLIIQFQALGLQLYLENGALRCRDPQQNLTADIIATLKAHKAEIIDFINQTQVTQSLLNSTIKADSVAQDVSYPLSFSQQRMWFLHQVSENPAAYNLPSPIRLRGKLNLPVLENTIGQIIARHDILRHAFEVREGQVLQQSKPQHGPFLTIEQPPLAYRQESAQCRQQVSDIIHRWAELPFNLENGPLYAFKLLVLSPTEHILMINLHHIIADGWSMEVLVDELIGLYRAQLAGSQTELPALAIRYYDYVQWQRDLLANGELDNQLAYWKNQLAQPSLLQLPSDFPRPAVRQSDGQGVSFSLPRPLVRKLQLLCQQQQSTLFMVLLAGFKVLLHRYSGQSDICVGTPVANRDKVELEPLIGLFINTLALRSEIDPNQSFRQFLAQVKAVSLAAFEHKDIPFEKVVDELNVDRDMSHNPVFQVLFRLQNIPDKDNSQAGLSDIGLICEDVRVGDYNTDSDLSLALLEEKNTIDGEIIFRKDLFTHQRIEKLIDHYLMILDGVTQDVELPIGQIQLLNPTQWQEIVIKRQGLSTQLPPLTGLALSIEQVAMAHPRRLACFYGEQSLSYHGLNAAANDLAHALLAAGVKKGDVIPVFYPRCLLLPASWLAILKIGAVICPLDITWPEQRLSAILADINPQVIVTPSEFKQGQSSQLLTAYPCVEMSLQSEVSSLPLPDCQQSGDDAVYVIYTSGTTGTPKGVVVNYAGLANRFNWMNHYFNGSEQTTTLQTTLQIYDSAIWQLLWPLTLGGRCVVPEDDQALSAEGLVGLIERHQITMVDFVPAVFKAMSSYLLDGLSLPSLKTIILGGEEFPAELATKMSQAFAGVQITNLYGPTEATIGCISYDLTGDESHVVPIGRPIDNVVALILDSFGQPVLDGVVGELFIGGDCLATGYLNQAELTKAAFIDNPFAQVAGDRLYRTGDLACWSSQGQLVYKGRIDNQVKIHGYRIELAEIEAVLTLHPQVDEAVIAVDEQANRKTLHGFVTLGSNKADDIDKSQLTEDIGRWVQSRLPAYMVPAQIVVVEHIPRSRSGKVNKKALPMVHNIQPDKTCKKAPRNSVELTLAQIWQSVLAIPELPGIYDNFFELGGDSILSIQIISRAARQGLQINPRQMFEFQTIAQLAMVAKVRDVSTEKQNVIALDKAIALTPIQCWFFEQAFVDEHYWLQSRLLDLPIGLSNEQIRQVCQQLWQHHDGLRVRFSRSQQTPQAHYQGEDAPLPYRLVDLRVFAQDVEQQLEAATVKAQQSIDLSTHLVQFELYLLPDNQRRLLFAVHHLMVDGVSWRILLEDMNLLASQLLSPKNQGVADALSLPNKSATWQHWAQALVDHAHQEHWAQQLSYWQHQLIDLPEQPQGNRYDTRGKVTEVRDIDCQLDSETTDLLLHQVSSAYKTEINDLLLTALIWTFYRHTGSKHLCIELEGHGREYIGQDIDVSRTVGWFTTVFPLNLQAQASLVDTLLSIKEQLRSVPDKGLGYGLLRYLSGGQTRLNHYDQPNIVFNYLGQFGDMTDNADSDGLQFNLSDDGLGAMIGPDNHYVNPLSINCYISDGRLQMEWRFAELQYDCHEVQGLTQHYLKTLQQLVQHCAAQTTTRFTPSDFPLAQLNQHELDTLLSNNRQNNHQGVENIYPLSPMQQGMLFHSLYEQNNESYFTQQDYLLSGQMDWTLFARSWDIVIARHSALRTRFYTKGLDRPLQLVSQPQTDSVVKIIDWRHIEPQQQQQKVAEFIHQDKVKGFVLDGEIPMRLFLILLPDNQSHFIWSAHHILFDAWSTGVIFSQVMQAYANGGELADEMPAYQHFIAYLESRDKSDEKAYWQQYLQGISRPTPLPLSLSLDLADSYQAQRQHLLLSSEDTLRLSQAAQTCRVTTNTMVQCAWALLLSRFSQSSKVVFGATVSGRSVPLPGIENMVGLLINTLPVAIETCAPEYQDERIAQFLQRVQHQQLNQGPFEHSSLVDILQYCEIPAELGLFDSLMVFENAPDDTASDQTQGALATLEINEGETTDELNYPLALIVVPGTTMALHIHFDGRYFEQWFIAQLLDQLSHLLRALCQTEQLVADIPLVGSLPVMPTLATIEATTDGLYPSQVAALLDNDEGHLLPKSLHLTAEPLASTVLEKLQHHGVNSIRLSLNPSSDLLNTTAQFAPIISDRISSVDERGYVAIDIDVKSPRVIVNDKGQVLPAGMPGWLYLLPSHLTVENALIVGQTIGAEWGNSGLKAVRLCEHSIRVWSWQSHRYDHLGQSIDLAAVERLLLNHASVCEVIAQLRVTCESRQVMVLYVVPHNLMALNDSKYISVLRQYLADLLPSELQPDAIEVLSCLPLTSQGTVDSQALTRRAVINTATLEQLSHQLLQRYDLADVEVRAIPTQQRSDWLHLDDILPAANNGQARAASVTMKETNQSVESDDHQWSLCHGPELTVADNRPVDMVSAFLATVANFGDTSLYFVGFNRTDVNDEHQITYAQLYQQACQTLNGLYQQGVQTRQVVLLQLDDLDALFSAFWACLLGGIIPVICSLPPHYRHKNSALDKVFNAWQTLDKPIIITGPLHGEQLLASQALYQITGMNTVNYYDLSQQTPTQQFYRPRAEEVAFYQLSSGSTGFSKCIQMTHQGAVSHILGSEQMNGLTRHDVDLNWLPLDHVGPILTCHLKDVYLARTQVQLNTAAVLNQPLIWLDAIERYRVTHSWSPNFGFKQLSEAIAQSPERHWDLSCIKYLLNGGEQVTCQVVDDLLAQLIHFGAAASIMQPSFGMAESCTSVTFNNDYRPDNALLAGFVNLGKPIAGVSLRIVDDNQVVVPEGVVGQFQIKGPMVTPGYLNNEQANRNAFVGDGWFNSGDLGIICDGQLAITGRVSEMLVIRGANYFCYEIEAVVSELSGVVTGFVSAMSIPDSQSGSDILAIAYGATDFQSVAAQLSTIKSIRRHVTEVMGLTPEIILPMTLSEFPRTSSGKIQRNQLRNRIIDKALDSSLNDTLKAIDLLLKNERTLPHWFYQRQWQPKQLELHTQTDKLDAKWMIIADKVGLAGDLGAGLTKAGQSVITLDSALDDGQLSEVTRVIYLPSFEPSNHSDHAFDLTIMEQRLQRGCLGVLSLLQRLHRSLRDDDRSITLTVVSCAGVVVSDKDKPQLAYGGLTAQLHSAGKEYPWLQWQQLDFDCQDTDVDTEQVSGLLMQELYASRVENVVAYRQSKRYVCRLSRCDMNQPDVTTPIDVIKAQGHYLISGGLGGVGYQLSRFLQKRYQVKLTLVGRQPLSELSVQQNARLSQLAQTDQVDYLGCDLSHEQSLQKVSSQIARLDGVFHLAGMVTDTPLQQQKGDNWQQLVAVKLYGGWQLSQLLHSQRSQYSPQAKPLMVNFSSLNGVFGGSGMGAYGAANGELEGLTLSQAHHHQVNSQCLHFSLWRELGMSGEFDQAQLELSRSMGYYALSPSQGLLSMQAALMQPQSILLIGVDGDKPQLRHQLGYQAQHTQAVQVIYQADEPLIAERHYDSYGTEICCYYHQVKQLVRDAQGQIDPQQLASFGQLNGINSQSVAATTNSEKMLAQIWQDLLKLSEVSIDDNFFELGGHSLLATKAMMLLQRDHDLELPIKALFDHPTIKGLAAYIDTQGVGLDKRQMMTKVDRQQPLALSYEQQRLWFIEQLTPGNSAYHIQSIHKIEGQLDLKALADAMAQLGQRHEILNCGFISQGGKPFYQLKSSAKVQLQYHDCCSELSHHARLEQAMAFCQTQSETPFDLEGGPLIRPVLLTLAAKCYVLVITIHHIIADGWSMNILFDELLALYDANVAATQAQLAPLPIQYIDYAQWQQNQFEQQQYPAHLAFWREMLKDYQELALGFDHPRPEVMSGAGAELPFTIENEVSSALRQLAQQSKCSLYSVMLTSYFVLQYRFCGQNDIVVGTTVANRQQNELENLIGFFANTLVLRIVLDESLSFSDNLTRVNQMLLSAFEHQAMPFDKIVDALNIERHNNKNPIFQSSFQFNREQDDVTHTSRAVQFEELGHDSDTSMFDLTLSLDDNGDELGGSFVFSTQLFLPSSIDGLLNNYQQLLAAIVQGPDIAIEQLSLMGSLPSLIEMEF